MAPFCFLSPFNLLCRRIATVMSTAAYRVYPFEFLPGGLNIGFLFSVNAVTWRWLGRVSSKRVPIEDDLSGFMQPTRARRASIPGPLT